VPTLPRRGLPISMAGAVPQPGPRRGWASPLEHWIAASVLGKP
jgi:hypothetical protein